VGLHAVEAKALPKEPVHHLSFVACFEHFANWETISVVYIAVIVVAKEKGNFACDHIIDPLQVHFHLLLGGYVVHHSSFTPGLF